jgi:hypothetical protein
MFASYCVSCKISIVIGTILGLPWQVREWNLFQKWSFTSFGENCGESALINEATPATDGDATFIPLSIVYSLLRYVDNTDTPRAVVVTIVTDGQNYWNMQKYDQLNFLIWARSIPSTLAIAVCNWRDGNCVRITCEESSWTHHGRIFLLKPYRLYLLYWSIYCTFEGWNLTQR